MKWEHDSLLADLAEHLAKPERMMWLDMPMGPAGSQRPDIWSLNKSFTRPNATTYEIKVSVNDYRSDITKGKWQGYLKYSCAVIFCVPQGLISKKDLPPGCGLMIRGENGWRTLKAPTMSRMPEIPGDVWLKLLMRGIEKEYKTVRSASIPVLNQYANDKRNFSKDVHTAITDLAQARYAVERAKKNAENILNQAKQQEMHIYEKAKEHVSKEREALAVVREELSKALGINLAERSWAWTARKEVQLLLDRLDRDKEISRLTKALGEVQQTLSKQLDRLLPDVSDDCNP